MSILSDAFEGILKDKNDEITALKKEVEILEELLAERTTELYRLNDKYIREKYEFMGYY